jgi:hypothetical protein
VVGDNSPVKRKVTVIEAVTQREASIDITLSKFQDVENL